MARIHFLDVACGDCNATEGKPCRNAMGAHRARRELRDACRASELVSYKHRNAPKARERFVQRSDEKLPEWAFDVRPHVEQEA